jgi:HEPN domain-containing protein
MAQQAIEKYLKAILLYNLLSAGPGFIFS